MELTNKQIIEITPLAPFNFDATFHKPAHFESGDNRWQPGIRWQTFLFLNISLGVKFINQGDVENPKIDIEIYSQEKLSEKYVKSFINEITFRYNLDLDLSDFYQRFVNNPLLGQVIMKWRGLKPGHQDSLYEYLIIGLILQNCTVKRSIQMMQVLFEKYGTLLEFDNQKLWCFWLPGGLKNISEDELRSLKIGYRAKSLKKIDEAFLQNSIDEKKLRQKKLETQKEKLLKLYGIGPATVWYLLFDVFHHYDFFDHISPWEQKIYSKLFFDIDPETPVAVDKILKLFKGFHPFEQLAVHYVWEDLWWRRKNESIPWLEKLVRI